jgi:cytosine deaminase
MILLLKNCFMRDDTQADIKIRDGIVDEMGPSIMPGSEWRVINVKGNLVSAGFVDCHMHLDKSLSEQKIINKSGTFKEALRIMKQFKEDVTRQDIKSRAKQVIERAIAHGTVAIRTNVDIDPVVRLKGFEALLELKEEYKRNITLQIVAFPQEGINKAAGTYELMLDALREGADVVGGAPNLDVEPELHIKKVFDLAEKFDLPLDMHVDEPIDVQKLNVLPIAEEAIRRKFIGRVSVAHCCALDNLPPPELEEVIAIMKEAQLKVVSLPSTNMYIHGRDDPNHVRRGIAPVKKLLKHGLRVAFASDNIQDGFNPFGNANLLLLAFLAAHGCHMGSKDELGQVFDMITSIPAGMLDLHSGIGPGMKADLIVLNAKEARYSIIEQASVLERLFNGKPDNSFSSL